MGKKEQKRIGAGFMLAIADRFEKFQMENKKDHTAIFTRLGEIKKSIEGNGKAGFQERLSRVEGGLIFASFLFGGGLIGMLVYFLLTFHKGG